MAFSCATKTQTMASPTILSAAEGPRAPVSVHQLDSSWDLSPQQELYELALHSAFV